MTDPDFDVLKESIENFKEFTKIEKPSPEYILAYEMGMLYWRGFYTAKGDVEIATLRRAVNDSIGFFLREAETVLKKMRDADG